MTKNITLWAAAALWLIPTTAFSATYNFADYANGVNSNGATFSNSLLSNGLGEAGYASYSVTHDGIKVTATGSANNDNQGDTAQFAYLDSYWDNREAGLGVCKDLSDTNQCAPSSDDNVTIGETLTLLFDQTVSIDSLTLANGDHYATFADGAKFSLTIDGSYHGDIQLAADLNFVGLIGTKFDLFNLTNSESPDTEFYINTMTVSAVPLPAAAWLFGSALFGLIGLNRRLKKSRA